MIYEDLEIEKARKLFSGECKFIAAAVNSNAVPDEDCYEIAFAGRSNVGKSSLVNALTNRKTLARTSQTPGRTRQLIFFQLEYNITKLRLVDLPGYGYAKISKVKRGELAHLIENYIINRDNLQQVFVLIDCKVGIKDKDIDIFDTICESNKKFSIILTKIDKCAVNFAESQKESLLSLMKNYKPHFNKIFSTSSSKNIGITDIQKDVFNLSKII